MKNHHLLPIFHDSSSNSSSSSISKDSLCLSIDHTYLQAIDSHQYLRSTNSNDIQASAISLDCTQTMKSSEAKVIQLKQKCFSPMNISWGNNNLAKRSILLDSNHKNDLENLAFFKPTANTTQHSMKKDILSDKTNNYIQLEESKLLARQEKSKRLSFNDMQIQPGVNFVSQPQGRNKNSFAGIDKTPCFGQTKAFDYVVGKDQFTLSSSPTERAMSNEYRASCVRIAEVSQHQLYQKLPLFNDSIKSILGNGSSVQDSTEDLPVEQLIPKENTTSLTPQTFVRQTYPIKNPFIQMNAKKSLNVGQKMPQIRNTVMAYKQQYLSGPNTRSETQLAASEKSPSQHADNLDTECYPRDTITPQKCHNCFRTTEQLAVNRQALNRALSLSNMLLDQLNHQNTGRNIVDSTASLFESQAAALQQKKKNQQRRFVTNAPTPLDKPSNYVKLQYTSSMKRLTKENTTLFVQPATGKLQKQNSSQQLLVVPANSQKVARKMKMHGVLRDIKSRIIR